MNQFPVSSRSSQNSSPAPVSKPPVSKPPVSKPPVSKPPVRPATQAQSLSLHKMAENLLAPWEDWFHADKAEPSEGHSKSLVQKSLDFLDEIVNPWEAPSLDDVRQGEVIDLHKEGPSVKALQQRLTALGYGVQDTGTFGPTTSEVLTHFQRDFGVQPTGKFGPTTLKMLERVEAWKAENKREVDQLEAMSPQDLKALGQKDPKAFFKALLPAAMESEREYGVPAAMTLAQAALESEWAKHPIGGYNIFGIKGAGPAGSVKVRTREVVKGSNHYINANFARYHNFYEAVKEHGKLYNNGYYDKGLQQYKANGNVYQFVDNVAKIYATAPNYARTIKHVMAENGLLKMVEAARKPKL